MDAARLQSKLYAGYGKSAQRVGYSFAIYRPTDGSAAIASGNVVGSSAIPAAFTPRSSGFNFKVTSDYIKPLFHGLFDATTVNVGDYLYNADHGTYFVVSKGEQLPVLCVQCNNTVSFLRAANATGFGVQGYSGAVSSTESPLITSWPASVIYEARGRNTGAALPMDDVAPYFIVLLPALTGIDLRPSDIMTDAETPTRRYVVSSSERSPMGWRIVAKHAIS